MNFIIYFLISTQAHKKKYQYHENMINLLLTLLKVWFNHIYKVPWGHVSIPGHVYKSKRLSHSKEIKLFGVALCRNKDWEWSTSEHSGVNSGEHS